MSQTHYFDIKEHIVPTSYISEYAGSTVDIHENALRLHVHQYIPRQSPRSPSTTQNKNAITLVGMHGISLPKEIYEPLWDELYRHSQSSGYEIRSIWIADMPNHGKSYMLNENKLSNDVSWMDMSRDMLFMINQFRSEMPRPIIGLGHSIGAVQMANMCYMHPRLFTSVVFLDPGFLKTRPPMGINGEAPGIVNFNTWRKDVWKNREAAAAFIRKTSPDWNPQTVEKMIEHGFRDLPTALHPDLPPGADPNNPPVTLATTKHHSCLSQMRECFDSRDENGRVRVNRETHADLDPYVVRMQLYRPEIFPTNGLLPTLRPPALFVLGNQTQYSLDDMHDAALQAGTGVGGSGGMREGKVREAFVDGGHMFPFTAVAETGKAVSSCLSHTISEYKDQEKRWHEKRSTMSKQDHLRLPEKWFQAVPSPFPPAKPTGKL